MRLRKILFALAFVFAIGSSLAFNVKKSGQAYGQINAVWFPPDPPVEQQCLLGDLMEEFCTSTSGQYACTVYIPNFGFRTAYEISDGTTCTSVLRRW